MSENDKNDATPESPKTTEYTRTDIQNVVLPAVKESLESKLQLKLESLSSDHLRRTVRALMHVAARLCIDQGVPPQPFIAQAFEAYGREAGASSTEELVAILKANASKNTGSAN